MNLYVLDREKEHLCSTVALLIAAESEDKARQIAMNYSILSTLADRMGLRNDPDLYEYEVKNLANLLAIFSNKKVNYELARHADEDPDDWLKARCLLIGQADPDTQSGVIMVDTIEP